MIFKLGFYLFFIWLFISLLIVFVCQCYTSSRKWESRESEFCSRNVKRITSSISNNYKRENLMKLIKNKVYYNTQRPLTHSMIYSLPSWTADMKIARLAAESTATNSAQLHHTDMWLQYVTHHTYTRICTTEAVFRAKPDLVLVQSSW